MSKDKKARKGVRGLESAISHERDERIAGDAHNRQMRGNILAAALVAAFVVGLIAFGIWMATLDRNDNSSSVFEGQTAPATAVMPLPSCGGGDANANVNVNVNVNVDGVVDDIPSCGGGDVVCGDCNCNNTQEQSQEQEQIAPCSTTTTTVPGSTTTTSTTVPGSTTTTSTTVPGSTTTTQPVNRAPHLDSFQVGVTGETTCEGFAPVAFWSIRGSDPDGDTTTFHTSLASGNYRIGDYTVEGWLVDSHGLSSNRVTMHFTVPEVENPAACSGQPIIPPDVTTTTGGGSDVIIL